MVCTLLHRFLYVYTDVSAGGRRVGIILPTAFLARGSRWQEFACVPDLLHVVTVHSHPLHLVHSGNRYNVYVCLVCVWLKGQVLQPQMGGRRGLLFPSLTPKLILEIFPFYWQLFCCLSLRCIILCRYKSLTVGQLLFLRFGY